MILELEILTGSRQGHRIWMDSNVAPPENLPYILETEAISITLTADRDVDQANLVVDNTTINLRPTSDNSRTFNAVPNRTPSNGFESLFFNYLGIVIFYAHLESDGNPTIEEVARLEVLARKASADQVRVMISFILDSEEEDLVGAQGPTKRSAGLDKTEGLSPKRLIEHLEHNVQLLQIQLPYILNAPLSTLSSRLQIRSGSAGIDIGDQGIAWLADNLSVLQPSDDPDTAMLEYQGEHYLANEIQTSIMHENKDIYENRILHGYLDNLLRFTHKLLQGYNESIEPTSLNQHDGYESFFSAMSKWMHKQNVVHVARILSLQDEIRLIQISLRKYVPVREVDRSIPRFTPKARANRQYVILFRSIHDWYQNTNINWGNQKLLLAINNIPKLFELYAVLLTRKWCFLNGNGDANVDGVFWRGEIGGHSLKLHYEPTYWMTGHVEESGNIVNTENRNISAAIKDHSNKRRHHKFNHRAPDIVLEFTKQNGDPVLVVLDAKYTSQKLAFERDLPACTLKYVHGLGSYRNPNLVKSMFIVYPQMSGAYHDYHAAPFDTFGKSPQLPMLGIQGLSLTAETTEKHQENLYALLTKAMTILLP